MNSWSLIPLASALLSAGLLLTISFQKKTRLNLVFVFFVFTSMAWSIFAFLLTYNPSSSTGQLIFWNNLLLISMVCSVFAYYHFVRTFVGKNAGIIVYIGYGLTIVFAGLCLGGWVVKNAYFSGGLLYHDIGPWANILMIVGLPTSGLCMWMLLKELRNSHNPMERNKLSYLLIGFSIGSSPRLLFINERGVSLR